MNLTVWISTFGKWCHQVPYLWNIWFPFQWAPTKVYLKGSIEHLATSCILAVLKSLNSHQFCWLGNIPGMSSKTHPPQQFECDAFEPQVPQEKMSRLPSPMLAGVPQQWHLPWMGHQNQSPYKAWHCFWLKFWYLSFVTSFQWKHHPGGQLQLFPEYGFWTHNFFSLVFKFGSC